MNGRDEKRCRIREPEGYVTNRHGFAAHRFLRDLRRSYGLRRRHRINGLDAALGINSNGRAEFAAGFRIVGEARDGLSRR